MPHSRLRVAAVILAAAACARSAESPQATDEAPRLPTGARLDPAGRSVDVGSMPLAMTMAPDGRHVVLLLNGWREQGVQVLDRATGAVVQTVPQAAAFIGLAFSPRANALFVSGGNQDVIYGYDWSQGRATLRDSVILARKTDPRRSGTRYPAGLALSPDGTRLYVAENLADSLAVIDLGVGHVVERHATERYPYGVAVDPNGDVFVSAWGGHTVSVFTPNDRGGLDDAGRVRVGRHPSALALNADGSRLFVASGSTDRIAVVDTRARRLVKHLDDPPPEGPAEGSTPNALTLSADGKRLFVAEADANAIAIFDLSAVTSNDTTARGDDLLAGRIPVGWYPTALALAGDTLWVVNGKGRGTSPNPQYPHPGTGTHLSRPLTYTLGQLSGTVSIIPRASVSGGDLAAFTERVMRANNWTTRRSAPAYPPIEHVVYIIKENRTYDQVLGDLPQGDGDTSLLFFPRPVSPNHHALAERFGIYDRFFVNAEVSPDGHNWSVAAYTTDYLQKTVPSNYSNRGRTYDYEGRNRCSTPPCEIPEDDVAEPASGYLWDLAQRAGITFRNYGEFVIPEGVDPESRMPSGYKGSKPFLAANTNTEFPGYDLTITDQHRADVFLREFEQFVRDGRLPRLIIMRLPNDHTAGARAGAPTPRAYMADNDLALGRVVEAFSRSPFWRSTAIFVVEDDAQNGPDHVDSHRTPFYVISPWARPGVHHRFTNTTDVVLTIEEILGLGSLSQFDYYGRPLRDVWMEAPDLRPYTALIPDVPLDERNPAQGRGARESELLDLTFEDVAEEDLFNQILWRAIKGENVAFPGVTRMSALEWKRAR
ncbi:MAG: bifunctional YncE family protein/alkaline phosphatase family protein [Gemmatimonadaceae bacterium]